ncbi:FlgO family outer membrane protein [Planctobacterium marinum]|uniref:FlgO family outer membrane protein n=1 Tax=Planctobacterium marinum TaxID=1631968 RepID=UPI001E57B33F|nr:FlgO family outer membrane protein [Planctobacterium marinum]MCC2605897.1 hypothetical protein [Planctobacterium marinum]
MKKIFLVSALLTSITGCAQWNQLTQQGAPEQPNLYGADKPVIDRFGAITQEPMYQNDNAIYQGKALHKHIGDYVQNMAQDLIANMEYVTDQTPVGVTHFALTDSDLNQTNLLGYQIAESFIHELHKFRIPVLDFKATDYIRVTETGDFLLSRDFLELKHKVPMQYILTGTMTKHQGGFLVNARILGLESKAVVATSQMLVPFYVVEALIPSDEQRTDGIGLIQGR